MEEALINVALNSPQEMTMLIIGVLGGAMVAIVFGFGCAMRYSGWFVIPGLVGVSVLIYFSLLWRGSVDSKYLEQISSQCVIEGMRESLNKGQTVTLSGLANLSEACATDSSARVQLEALDRSRNDK